MEVNPGVLSKKIQIYRKTSSGEDEEGYPLEDGEEIVRNCYAAFSRTSGTVLAKSGTELSEVKCRFLVRYSPKSIINETMYIRYNGHVYEILYVNDYEDKHEYIEIWCKGES